MSYNQGGFSNRGYTGQTQDAYAPPRYQYDQQNPQDGYNSQNPYATPQQGQAASRQQHNENESYEMTSYIGDTEVEARQNIHQQVKRSKEMMNHILDLRRRLLGSADTESDARHTHEADQAATELHAYNKQLVMNIRKARTKFGTNTNIEREMGNYLENVREYSQAEKKIANDLETQLANGYKVAKGLVQDRKYANEHEREEEEARIDQLAREAVRSGEAVQAFQNAALGARRQGAQNALTNAQTRYQEIQKIEQQMEQIAILSQQINLLIQEQEAPIEEIVKKTDETREDMHNGVMQLDSGIENAKSARRKKWWCLLIVVVIIIIIVIVIMVVVVKPIIQESNKNKRSLEYLAHTRRTIIEGLPTRRSIPPQARALLY